MTDVWRSLRCLLAAGALILLAACATPAPQAVMTGAQQERAYVEDVSLARFWADEMTPTLAAGVASQFRQIEAAARTGIRPASVRRADYLAISGGGGNGAFAAGYLQGWSRRGDRPQFEVVTGVSTGALAAPFAFLGPRYDATLEQVYTIYGDHDILRRPNLLGVFGTSLYDNAPLRNLIASFMSDAVLEAIAAEYQHGRRLLVQTTNLSAQRPVIWDLTTICASNRTDRRELVINILLASASVPAVLPPVHMKVRTEGGRTFEELHVDGGVSAQIFFAPPEIGLDDFERKAFGRKRTRNLYVIRNGQLEPVYEPVVERTLPIARRAIETMTRYQGVSDLNRLQTLAHRGNANLFYVSIPQSFVVKPTSEFDKAYMRQLFAEGVREGRAGTWMQEAPVTPVLARNGPAAN